MRAALFSTTLLVLLSSAARANPVDAFGFGSRGGAMANALTAIADDAAANYYNAAALARPREMSLEVGYRFAQPLLRTNGHDAGVDASRGWNIGLAVPSNIGPFRFAVGVAVFLPDQRLTRTRAIAFGRPYFSYYDNRPQRLFFVANLAVQIARGLYVGAGLTFMSRMSGNVALRGAVAISDPEDSSLVTQMDVDLLAVRYPQAGIRWDATRNLSFGLTYRHEFVLEAIQNFDITGSIGNPGLPPVVPNAFLSAKVRSLDLFQPLQVTGAVAARLLRSLVGTFELTYARWSTHPPGASEVDIVLDVGQFNSEVMTPPKRAYPPAGFRDVLVPRFAIEARARDGERLGVDVRGGYAYEPTPVPDQIGESSFIDMDKHTFSLGAGLEIKHLRPILTHPLVLDVHFGATYLPERVTRKWEPLHPIGDFRADGVVVQTGLSLRTRF